MEMALNIKSKKLDALWERHTLNHCYIFFALWRDYFISQSFFNIIDIYVNNIDLKYFP